ncbi:MAG: tetratricopeptide repeat protein, partial [Pyrinomonadaceae bacterium]
LFMLPNEIAHYCQKCLAANPLGLEFCGRCGTRLMLIVEPPAMRFETGNASVYNEDHLLERVSALENMLSRLTERLEQTLDLLLRQAQNTYLDHTLIETLVSVLNDAGTVRSEKVYELWQERAQKDSGQKNQSSEREKLSAKIMEGYEGVEQAEFSRLVREGLNLLGDDEPLEEQLRGLRSLERAAAIAPSNAALCVLISEHLFALRKMTLAKDYLERAHALAPESRRICLLLGLACADAGEAERAKDFLGKSMLEGAASFAAHYCLGMLLATEARWREALTQFKRALALRPSPEAHYVLGTVYYEMERDRMAARHLRQAIETDENYAAAFFMLGLVLIRTGELVQAKEAFDAAYATSGGEPIYRSGLKRGAKRNNALPSLLFGTRRVRSKRLLTGGDKRLANLVFEDALRFGLPDAD